MILKCKRTTGLALIALIIGLAFLAVESFRAPAFAAGSSSRSKKPVISCPANWYYSERCKACAKSCPSGKVWSCKAKKCLTRSGEKLNDKALYLEAVSLIKTGEYRSGLDLLLAIEKRDDPKVLNYIGFSTRKLGDVEKGIEYYNKALKLDPNYNLAREYLGEGYLQQGALDKAKEQLTEIASRNCAPGCEAYDDLAEEIVKYEAKNKAKAQ
jgi:tetratricopeptide (TPR) repeat protein